MRNKGTLVNIDNSDLAKYPAGRIKNQTGAGDGTPVNEEVYGDLHEAKDKLMRLYGIAYNGLPDNETNGYQLIDALIALASKNDFIVGLGVTGVVLNVALKLGKLKDNEAFILKAGVDFDELNVTIKGSDNVTKPVTVLGEFKVDEYVRMISTPGSIVLIRMVDSFNLDLMVNELAYLKAASIPEDIAGVLLTKACTPGSALAAFVNRVIGDDSDDFLATAIRNGLYPKEHWTIVNAIGANKVRNIGTLSSWNVEVPIVGATFPVTGDIASATVTVKSDNTNVIRVVVNNTMTDLAYYVRTFIEGNSGDIRNDNSVGSLIFKPINETTFDITMREFTSQTQSLKIHFEVVKI
jgi:hypothetical protein